jgi:hypothetical protein
VGVPILNALIIGAGPSCNGLGGEFSALRAALEEPAAQFLQGKPIQQASLRGRPLILA